MAFNYQSTTDSEGAGDYIFGGKTLIIFFVFEGAETFLTPKLS
jgi:hypothetical protein